MSTTCDLNVDWRACPNCARFKECIEDAEKAAKAVSANLDRAYAGYREDIHAGRACPATPRQRAWRSYLDDLEMEQSLASTRWTESIDAWAVSINEHHRRYEARQQEAEGGKGVAADTATGVNENTDTDDAMPCTCAMCQAEDGEPAETEEMPTTRKDAAVDALVNIYGGHIDKWLEALRERGSTHTDANDNNAERIETTSTDLDEPFEKEDKLARKLFGKLWYGDVPELELPSSYLTLSPMTLAHCARAIGLYKRMLKRYVPDLADNRPAWVAHRLMDAFDDAAEASEDALSSPTPQERAEYYTERDQCDQDDEEREKRREAARRIIADYMGVDPDDVHIICSGVFGGGR